MKRGDLYKIYIKLRNLEKSTWATKAGYATCQGLYRYLQLRSDEESDEIVQKALIEAIGAERLKSIIPSEVSIRLEYKRALILEIFETTDIAELEQIKRDIESAVDSQLSKIQVLKQV